MADDDWKWTFKERARVMAKNTDTPLADNPGSPGGMYAAQNYDNYELNNKITSYSELRYEQIIFNVGGTYNFTDTFYTTVSGTYDVFNMDDEYVYGDEDGKSYYGYAGIGWNF
ncbi:MAG: hypothetical protein DRP70_16950 [Spirochaetes bacterium]|nr:MAG: hypothetical protein DRP70_16950 [Spirochaetota bacterium]